MSMEGLKQILGKEIEKDSSLFDEIHKEKGENDQLVMELNSSYKTQGEIHEKLSEITGQKVDQSSHISLPFYTDFGKHIRIGKRAFINQNVTFVDLGSITIEDDVLIGPMSRLITVNHITDAHRRRGIIAHPIVIKKNAWIGANVTILPGVTIGENSIVAADSTVTKDVTANVIVAGSPAKVIKELSDEK